MKSGKKCCGCVPDKKPPGARGQEKREVALISNALGAASSISTIPVAPEACRAYRPVATARPTEAILRTQRIEAGAQAHLT